MTTVLIELPDETLIALKMSAEEVGHEIRLASAVDWYRRGLVSQGRAAEISGLPRTEFIDALAERRIDVVQVDLTEIRTENGQS